MIQDLRHNRTGSVHDIHVMNNDSISYLTKTPEKCLQEKARAKYKDVPGGLTTETSPFLPFVASVYGLLDGEEVDTLKRIFSHLEKYCQQPYSRT